MRISTGASEAPERAVFTRESGFPFWTIGRIESGVKRVATGGEEGEVPCHHFTLTPADTPYQIHNDVTLTEQRSSWVFFQPDDRILSLLDWPRAIGGARRHPVPVIDEGDEWLASYRRLFAIDGGSHPLRDRLLENALEQFFLLAWERLPEKTWAGDSRIREAAAILGGDLDTPLSLKEVAGRIHLSESSLSHLFRDQVGVSPMRYREAQRIRTARSLLLSTDQPVKRVAAALGFRNAYHFSTRFRALTGMSPTAFRLFFVLLGIQHSSIAEFCI
ncbi:MAG: helix-turn-helix domain-containing protein [Planctomycetota bacterium]|jgi:AraC family transcriptional regulator of arabinose operon